jgi:tripartite-type tricarboxylate transporter receptor subunit TctC
MKLLHSCALALGLLTALGGSAFAQPDSYPSRPVEMIVPWPAGGGTDAVARVFADSARAFFPQPIVIVNRPGAIGSIGFAYAAASKPDGYRVVLATPEFLIAPYLGIGKTSPDAFVPIARLNADPSAITVRSDSPWKTIEQFLAHARANPEKVTVSTPGSGSVADMAGIDIEEKTKLKFSRIPYQGEAPAIQAILAGQVDATVISPGSLSAHVQAGKLRVLAVASPARVAEFKDVPTFREKGIDVALGTWRGLLVPKGTPPEIVNRWNELAKKVAADPKFQESLKKLNINAIYENGDHFAKVMAEDDVAFKRLAPKVGTGTN